MRISHILMALGIITALVTYSVTPAAAAGIGTNTSAAALIPVNETGNDGSLFSTVKSYRHGHRWGGGWYPYYGGYYSGYYPYRSWYGDGYGYYTRGNKTCVFSGYGYRCYGPSKYYYY